MSVGGLVVALVLALVVLMFILSPLVARRAEPTDAVNDPLPEKQRERLVAYYDRVLRNLHDLDEDQSLGKIEPELYERDRALWVERGVQALKALDTLNEQHPLIVPESEVEDAAMLDRAIDDAIEAAVQRAKQGVR